MPRALQEQSMLRIEHPRGKRWEAEEVRVELIDRVEQRCAAHIRRIGQCLLADTFIAQLLFGQRDDRLLAAGKIAPERRKIIGAWKFAGHADHRDRVVGDAHWSCPPCTPGLALRRMAAPCRAAARCCARSRTVSAFFSSPGLFGSRSGPESPSWSIRSAARLCRDAPCSISVTGGSTPKSARAPLRMRTALRESSPKSGSGTRGSTADASA